MPRINFPNVPNASGVPAIARGVTKKAVTSSVLGLAQAAIWKALRGSQDKWGIYTKTTAKKAARRLGVPIAGEKKSIKEKIEGFTNTVMSLDPFQVSVLSLGFSGDAAVSDFPIEEGSFASYNKVRRPERVQLTYAVGGKDKDRMFFLSEIRDAKNSNLIVDVWMPEQIGFLTNYCVINYSMNRSAESGANLFIVNVDLMEIKEVTAQYSSTGTSKTVKSPKKAASKPAVKTGKVQPKVPPKPVIANASYFANQQNIDITYLGL